jgi:hypothetical protein
MITPTNWYWIVAGSTTEVWSSAQMQYVPVTDATYQAWLSAGGIATNILNAGELFDVLQQQVCPTLQAQGVQVVSTGTPAISGAYAIDAASIGQAAAVASDLANGDGLPGGGATFVYLDTLGPHGPMSQANFLAVYKAAKNYVYQFTQSLSALVAGGQATMPTQPLTIP